MAALGSFIQEIKGLSLNEFMAKYNHPFLTVQGQRDIGLDEELSKDTELESTDDLNPEIHIFPVKEQADSSAFGFMTIGRSSKNHIVIHSSVISKIHAIIHKEKTDYSIVDAGSNNGTKLNNQPLLPNKPCVLHDKDTAVLAGKIIVQFLSCASAYRWIQEKAGDPTLIRTSGEGNRPGN